MEQVQHASSWQSRAVTAIAIIAVLFLLQVWPGVLVSVRPLGWNRCSSPLIVTHEGMTRVAPAAPAAPAAAAAAALAPDWPPSMKHPSTWAFAGVQQPNRSEGDLKLVPLCNASYVRRHPLSYADYMRSYTPGDPCLMPPGLLQRLQTGAPLKITVVGGSVTAGRHCYDGQRINRTCAWSSRLQDRLLEVFPKANVTVANAAIAGFGYTQWVRNGMLDDVTRTDLVIVDAQVNSFQYGFEAYKQMEEVDVFLHSLLAAARRERQHIGVLFVETFSKLCSAPYQKGVKCDGQCGNAADGLQGAIHTSISGYNISRHWCNHWWTTPDIERPVVRNYRLPIASYRDAVWPKLNQPRPDLPCMWNGNGHPDAIAHTVLGDVITYGLIRALVDSSNAAASAECEGHNRRLQQQPTRFYAQMTAFEYCNIQELQNASAPGNGSSLFAGAGAGAARSPEGVQGTFMSVFAPHTSFQPVKAGSWLWREDVPGKPGWVYDPAFSPINTRSGQQPAAAPATSLAATAAAGSNHQQQQKLPRQQHDVIGDDDVIWFKVRFSDRPQLQVTYQASYEHMGAAELTVHRASDVEAVGNSTALHRWKLAAVLGELVSVPKTTVFAHHTRHTSNRAKQTTLSLPLSVGRGEFLVAFRPQPMPNRQRFKLLGITSC